MPVPVAPHHLSSALFVLLILQIILIEVEEIHTTTVLDQPPPSKAHSQHSAHPSPMFRDKISQPQNLSGCGFETMFSYLKSSEVIECRVSQSIKAKKNKERGQTLCQREIAKIKVASKKFCKSREKDTIIFQIYYWRRVRKLQVFM